MPERFDLGRRRFFDTVAMHHCCDSARHVRRMRVAAQLKIAMEGPKV
jgi:hypothetical protein